MKEDRMRKLLWLLYELSDPDLEDFQVEKRSDPIDEATKISHQDVAIEILEQRNKRHQDILHALTHNSDSCEVCDQEIPRARLEAVPWATMCVGCQKEFEKEKDEGEPERLPDLSEKDWDRLITQKYENGRRGKTKL